MTLIVNQQQQHEQVCQLLTEAVTMLCKNMLTYSTNLCIEGLIGVTMDCSNVILVNIKETITQTTQEERPSSASESFQTENKALHSEHRSKSSKLKRRRLSGNSDAENYQTASDLVQEMAQEDFTERRATDAPRKEGSSSNIIACSIKQECELTTECDEASTMTQQIEFGNGLPLSCSLASSGWPEFNESQAKSRLPEPSIQSWPQRRENSSHHLYRQQLEMSSYSEAASKPLPVAFVMDKSIHKNNVTTRSNDYINKHRQFSFTVEHDPLGSEIFVCECGEPFRHRSSLYRHQMMHLGMAYRCDLCGIVMKRKDNLLTHKRRYCLAQKQKNANF